MKIKANLLKYKDPNTGSYSPIPVVVSGEDIANKQDKVDNTLNTTDKTIVGSINELSDEIANKSDFSGDYNDLTNKPTIPSLSGYATETYVDNKIKNIESETIPSYIVEEAERVAKAVQSVRTAQTLTMISVSDMHVKVDDDTDNHPKTRQSVLSASMGIDELKKRIHIDLFNNHGDSSWMDATNYSANQTMKDLMWTKKTLGFDDNELWSVGNHDWCYGAGTDRLLTEDEIYAYIGANSDSVKPYEEIERGYGYIDFDNYKIRVINLNTCDCKDGIDGGTNYHNSSNYARLEFISPTQMRWVADVGLNFADKGEGWGVVFVSHHPLDYGSEWFTHFLKMLEAYKDGSSVTLSLYKYHNGTSWTMQSETFDFTNITNKAEIICNVHGHSHNCGSKRVSSSDSVTAWLWRFCVPNMCVGRENEKWNTAQGEVDDSGNAIYHRKTTGTAKETAFNVVSIDRKNQKIYAHIFGAGKDREFSYLFEEEQANLLDMTARTIYTGYTEQYIEATATHEMDYTKVYATDSGNKRGSYPTSKFTNFTATNESEFSVSCSSSSGYRLEFPINVKVGKTYSFSANSNATTYGIKLLKYELDGTFYSSVDLYYVNNGTLQTNDTFTAESNYLYSISFPFGSGSRTYSDISLVEV